MTVNTAQRFTKERHCPVCGGYDKQQRNQGGTVLRIPFRR